MTISSLGNSTIDVPIEHLDYGYVGKCKNARELERILEILRSGKEGMYPQLIDFTEKKLKEVFPKRYVRLYVIDGGFHLNVNDLYGSLYSKLLIPKPSRATATLEEKQQIDLDLTVSN